MTHPHFLFYFLLSTPILITDKNHQHPVFLQACISFIYS